MARVTHELLHRGRGVLVGAAVGDALARVAGDGWPVPVLGGRGELTSSWGSPITSMVQAAERVLRGEGLDVGAAPTEVLGAAVADTAAGRGAPLLVDGIAAAVYDAVAGSVAGRGVPTHGPGGVVGEALACADTPGFEEALRGAWEMGGERHLRTALAGALAGARLGVTAVPSRWLTYAEGHGGRRLYRHRDLLRLADRLVGFEVPMPPDPRRRIGPVEVFGGIWAANAFRVPAFVERHPDGAVISMCPMGDLLDGHRVRRTVLIEDVAVRAANPRLAEVIEELVATIAAFRAEGREVLVHCHHGVSRTGLALRAWLMHETGLSEPDATSEVEARWPWLSTANRRFTQVLADRSVR